MKTLFEVPPVHLKGVSLQVWDCQWLGGLAVSILRRRKSSSKTINSFAYCRRVKQRLAAPGSKNLAQELSVFYFFGVGAIKHQWPHGLFPFQNNWRSGVLKRLAWKLSSCSPTKFKLEAPCPRRDWTTCTSTWTPRARISLGLPSRTSRMATSPVCPRLICQLHCRGWRD